MKTQRQTGWQRWGAWGLVLINWLAVVVSFDAFPLSKRLGSHDSSMFMYFGHAMNHGMTPYVDMFDHKGIVLFWLEQLADLIGLGHQRLGVWLLEAAFYALFLIALWRLLLKLTQRPVVTGITILFLTPIMMTCAQGGNLTEQLSLPFITVAVVCFVDLLLADRLRHEQWQLVLIGLSGGLVFFIRANMVAPWVIGCLVLAVQSIARQDWRGLGRRIAWIFLGGISVVLVVVIYGWLAGNLQPMIEQTFTLNMAYSRQIKSADRLVAIRYFIRQSLNFGLPLFGLLFLLAGWFTGASGWWILVTLAYAGLNMLTVILSGRPYPHYFVTMLPVLGIMIALSLTWSADLMDRHPRTAQTLFAGLLTVSVLVSITPRVTLSQTTRAVKNGLYTTAYNQRTQSAQAQAARYIRQHSTANTTIYVHRIDAFIYLDSQRWANSRYFTLPSLDYAKHPHITADFEQQLQTHAPKFIVTRQSFVTDSHTGLDQSVTRAIQTKYRLVRQFQDPSLKVAVYQHR